ncbi:LIM domain-binding protein 2 isoform X11 [Anomalospiza imberbis]
MKPLRLKARVSCELRSWTAAGSAYRPVSHCNGTKGGHLKHTALAYHSLIRDGKSVCLLCLGGFKRLINVTSRRHTPYMVQPEYRIYEMNKRLQSRTEDSDNLWWDAFATEFFEDDATLTLSFCLEDGPKRYTIGRTLIPRYFSTVFEGGVTDLYYILKHSKESYHNSSITVDCDQCTMVTQHGKPMFTKVCTEGRLILEFTFDDLMRIKTWHFTIRQYRELVPRSILAMHAQDPQVLEQLSKNITRMGLTNFTLNYLRLCVILEPMQELMSRHKTYNLSPRDCLKTCLFQKWQRMVAPPAEPTRQPTTKRRKRKNSTSSTSNSSAGNNANSTNSKKKSAAANLSLSSQVSI